MCQLEEWTSRLERDWDDLAQAAGAPPFARPGWVSAMRDVFFPGERLVLRTVRDERGLAALVPVLLTRRAATSPTNWHTPSFAPVTRDPGSAVLLADALLALPVHVVDLRFVSAEVAGLVRQTARARGDRVFARRLQRSPYVMVDEEWSTFQARFGRNLRRDVRRKTRRLGEQGRVTWHEYDGRERLPELLAEGFALEASGWKGAAGTAIRSRPDTLAFYTRVAEWAADRDVLRMTMLRVDGRAVAFEFNLEQGGVSYGLKTGYDEAFSAFSPGTLNFLRLVERVCGDPQVRVLEMLGDATPWKASFASGTHELFQVTAFVHPFSRDLALASAHVLARGRQTALRLLPEPLLARATRT